MAHDIYIVLTQPNPGSEALYHHWYSNQHLPDLLAIPGIESAQRYSLEQHYPAGEGHNLFLALYELNNTPKAIEGILARRGTSLLRSSDTLNRAATKGVVFTSVSSISHHDGLSPITTLDEFSLALCTIKGDGATEPSGYSEQSQLPAPLSFFSGLPHVRVMHSEGAQANAGRCPFQYALFMPTHMLPQAIASFAETTTAPGREKAEPLLLSNIVFSARAL